MGTASQKLLDTLVSGGAATTALMLQDAADNQVNNASTTSADTNPSLGNAVPTMIGHTRTVAYPLWQGNAKATVQGNGDEVDTVDFAVLIGYPGPRSGGASLMRVWFDNNPVYDSSDPTVTTLAGDQLELQFYNGKQEAADPTILLAEGVAPAFTGRMYVVFKSLVTRRLTAATTVTQFTALPEVQCEVQQVAADDRPGIRMIQIAGDTVDKPAVLGDQQYVTYNADSGIVYILTHDGVKIYDAHQAAYVGETLFDVGYGFLKSNNMIPLKGMYIKTSGGDGNNNIATVINTDDGSVLWTGSVGDHWFGAVDSNSGYIVGTGYGAHLYKLHDGGRLELLFSGFSGRAQPGLIDDIGTLGPNNTADAMLYFSNGINLFRLVVTSDGSAKQVGLITHDGSNKPVTRASGPYILPTAYDSPGAPVCDAADNRYLYSFVETGGALYLVKLGTFYYFNPQDGSAPPAGTDPRFSNFEYVQELDRVALPGGTGVGAGLQNNLQYRDKRYPQFAYVSGAGAVNLIVVNYRNMNYTQYVTQHLFDADGNVVSNDELGWGSNIWFPQRKSVFYYGNMTLLDGTVQAGPYLQVPVAATKDGSAYTLASLYIDICRLGGYDDTMITCTGMDDQINGMQLNQNVDFSDLLNQLNAAFRVDMLELPDGGLSFDRRLNVTTPDYTITPDLLLPGTNDGTGNTIAIDRVATNELPTVLQLSFINDDAGFVVGAASVRRAKWPIPVVKGDSYLALSIPIVMGAEDAVYYAGVALFDMWAGKSNFQINLPPMFFFVQPGDFIAVVRPSGRVDLCKVTEWQWGQDKSVSLTLSSVSALKPLPFYQNALMPTQGVPAAAATARAYGTFTTASPSGTYATVIDNVVLSPADSGVTDLPLYLVSSAPADFYIKEPNGQPVLVASTPGSLMGTATSLLPDAKVQSDDITAKLVVTVFSSTIPIPTEQVVLVGSPGRWEAVGYDSAVRSADGLTVTLTGLTRGAKGTVASSTGHKVGDTVVFAPTGLARGSLPLSAQSGGDVTVYAMPPGKPASPILGVTGSLPVTGAVLVPRAPGDAKATRQGNGDMLITWHRVDRLPPSGDFWDDPPLSDAPESYDLSFPAIVNGVAVSKVVTCGTSSYTYTVADQTADGNANVIRLLLTIAQRSQTAGLGSQFKDYVYVR